MQNEHGREKNTDGSLPGDFEVGSLDPNTSTKHAPT